MSDNIPESLNDPNPDVILFSVAFADGYEGLEITYAERRHATGKAFVQQTITFDASLLRQEDYLDVIDSLHEFLDTALRHVRTDGGD